MRKIHFLVPTSRLVAVAPLVVGLVAGGCAHKPEVKPAAPSARSAGTGSAATAANTPAERACTADSECGDRELCVNSRCVPITPELAECSGVRVHFDLDATTIHPDDRPQLERISRCLKADRVMHVTIEGNADERGTEEYNMALGDQRALAVARYLEALGVSEAQLKTVSYGKEKPLCTEHDEACWSKNRRAAVTPQLSHR